MQLETCNYQLRDYFRQFGPASALWGRGSTGTAAHARWSKGKVHAKVRGIYMWLSLVQTGTLKRVPR